MEGRVVGRVTGRVGQRGTLDGSGGVWRRARWGSEGGQDCGQGGVGRRARWRAGLGWAGSRMVGRFGRFSVVVVHTSRHCVCFGIL